MNEEAKTAVSNALDVAQMVNLSDSYVAEIGQQIERRAKLLRMAVKALLPHDIQDFDGRPYIEGEGAARIMSAIRGFAVGESVYTVEREDNHYFVECVTPISWMGADTVGYGDCSTADSFFTGRDGKGGKYKKFAEQTGSDAIASRLILPEAKKKARENSLSRAVCELLGIKGMTWKDLEELGFNRTQAGAKVEFKKSSQGGEVKELSMKDALDAPKGSKFNLRGTAVKINERQTKTGKDITDYTVQAGESSIIVMRWGKKHEGIEEGKAVFVNEIAVDEYQGRPTYTAKGITAIEPNTGGEPQ